MRIRNKIILAFLLISLGSIALLGVFSFQFAKNQLISVRGEQLSTIISHQKYHLQHTLTAWQDRSRLIASRTQLRLTLEKQLNHPEPQHVKKMQRILNDALASVRQVQHISLCSPTGVDVVSVGAAPSLPSLCPTYSFSSQDRFTLHDIWMDSGSSAFSVLISGPVLLDSSLIGTIHVVLRADDLLDIVTNYYGLGSTGETLFARQDASGNAQFLTPLRYDPNPNLSRTIPLSHDQVPITRALLRQEAYLSDSAIVDYRGVPVLAATAYIDELSWGLVAKIDRDDALQPVDTLLYAIIGFASILSILVTVIGLTFSRAITLPILHLASFSYKVKSGDFSQRASLPLSDEVGFLAETLNSMVSSLEVNQTEREKLIEKLTASNEELERFAYVASHDLQEPLRMVINFTSLLQEELGDNLSEDAKTYIQFSVDAASRMRELIDDLLEYSRIESTNERREAVDSLQALKAALDNLQEAMTQSNATVTYNDHDFPTVYANSVRMTRLLQNLIGNAIKYCRKGVSPEVSIDVKDTSEAYIFSVRDNGIGIHTDYFEQVFSPFTRLHGHSEYTGTGIGLAICKKIVEQWGGSIWIESKMEEGSVFYFSIPKQLDNE